ncbi:helix-turn-helix domain-containing protein [uncultured Dubosiella sp.]|uniref:helix-turn-helix domain-containing protein n=1 Tax=uncultured Dubosiella sp. TaxID=1937011 RepID=UPI00272E971D|nr:helix-turn-helix transcriptional regulator [uncultured Dubosiella sp.]
MTTGDVIRKLRKEKGWTQQELGDRLGVQKSAIAKYESGRVKNLKRTTIKKMAEIFNVDPMVFIDSDAITTIDPQWGDDAANRDYLADKPDLLAIYNDLVKSDELTILFDKTKDLEPKDIESVLVFVQMLRKQRGMDD